MILFILSIIAYIALLLVDLKFFLLFSPPVFLLMVYILPLLINWVLTHFQKKELKVASMVVFPTLSALFFLAFAYLTLKNGSWFQFIELNTVSGEDVSIDISSSLLEMGQLTFMALVYYGGCLIQWMTHKYSSKKEQRG